MVVMTNNGIQTIDIIQGSFGCTGCSDHYDVDPYWDRDAETSFVDAASGDGVSYCGLIETVERLEGETDQEFVLRARQRAANLEIEHNLRHCRHCRCGAC